MNVIRKQWLSLWLAGLLLLVIAIMTAFAAKNLATSNAPKAQSKAVASPTPIRISIPSILVDASIEEVGLTNDGAVDVPKDPAHAAWFNRSVRPGDVGDSVIDGHYGWKDHRKAVFDNLSKLRVGDEISVQNSTGTTTRFIVRELRTVASNQIVPDIFISRDEKVHLNLITCEGTWDATSHSYSGRLVVFADKK